MKTSEDENLFALLQGEEGTGVYVCACTCVSVSHQVGASSPIEEGSIWVNFQGHKGRGPAIGLLDNKRIQMLEC